MLASVTSMGLSGIDGYLVSVVIFIVGQLLSFAGPHYSTPLAKINHFRSNRPVSV